MFNTKFEHIFSVITALSIIGALLSWENYHRLGKAITLNFGNFQIDLTYYLKEYINNSLNRTTHTVLKLRTRLELTGR